MGEPDCRRALEDLTFRDPLRILPSIHGDVGEPTDSPPVGNEPSSSAPPGQDVTMDLGDHSTDIIPTLQVQVNILETENFWPCLEYCSYLFAWM